ncbi:MFS transporter [Vibrio sp. 10N.286.49.B3]|uniref:sugar porter family MFS transporter n=1 Tax=Vibrio sp. 10N.286.49.B3 TaxID=1880855 RepID=UPI000C859B5C|nr:sugar porter family MFS transporter [Vibrio sp. 10N.286.49.B3]PMH45314.1 MFS transporter [Vibrio sp. 10N.286.49.B3]
MNHHTKNAIRYALIVALGGFVFGLDAAIISGTIRYISMEFGLSDLQIGTVVGAPSLGAIIALFFAGKIADTWGRKNTLILIAGLYVFSAVGSALSTSYEMLVAARFIGGLAFSSLSLASMYIGEVAPSRLRGKLVSCNQFNIVIGLSMAYFINYYLVINVSESIYLLSSEGIWRTMLASELVPATLWFGLLFTVPESPRWLITRGKVKEAKKVLSKLYAPDTLMDTVKEINATMQEDKQPAFGHQLKSLITSKYRTALVIGVTIAIVQGITGMNAILFYAPTVFEQVGFGGNAAFQQAIYIGLTSVIFTVIAIMFIDKLGRRPLLLIGLTFAVFSHLTCWYGFNSAKFELTHANVEQLSETINVVPLESLKGKVFNNDVEFKDALSAIYSPVELVQYEANIIEKAITVNTYLVLFGILGFIAAFHISIGPIMWVLFSEIFPNSVRSAAIPVSAIVTSIASYLIQQFFPWQLANLGAANTFLMYAIFSGLGLALIAKLLPETKDKSIEQIEVLLSSNSSGQKIHNKSLEY